MKPDLFAKPPMWPQPRLEEDRQKAIELFREERVQEPLENYLDVCDSCKDDFDILLETTVDLTQLYEHAVEVLTNPDLKDALRYLTGPPISLDDLKVVAEAPSIAPKIINANPDVARRIIDRVLNDLDRRRFPWISEEREATEQERASAVLASATMMASQRVATGRRNEGKTAQERSVRETLERHGFRHVGRRQLRTLADAPKPGEFYVKSYLGKQKADLLVRLWDERILPIECKVSNSATNSIKRLNHDAAVKAETWRKNFGDIRVVPTAVLSGVYSLGNLEDAQRRGLTLFWAHDLSALTAWIDSTRNT